MEQRSSVAVEKETRDKLRAYKQGDITTYDEILQAMIDKVDPEELVGDV